MRIALMLQAFLPLFVEYINAGKVYSVHDYRRIVVDSDTATVRRVGNTYIFPRYRVSSRTSVKRCSYGGYSRECCAGWSRNRDGSCSPICTNNCVHGICVAPDMCKCNKGYTGKSCNRDLNECGLEPRPCDHRCTNTQGSFKCYCKRGFILLEDERTCVRDKRCYPGRCSHACAFSNNEVTCVCPPGLRLIEDGYHCKDIDECSEGLITCPAEQECRNTFGNFLCVCKEGFQFQHVDGYYHCVGFVGLGECSAYVNRCVENSDCVYYNGLYRCDCREGYHGNGDICVLISKRTCEAQPCFPGVECEDFPLPDPNDVGLLRTLDIILRYQCGPCPFGYVGDGEMCDDINECEIEPPFTDCHSNAICENLPGDYQCMCSEGFFGNGTHCSKIGFVGLGECSAYVDRCLENSGCVYYNGLYRCDCREGYHGNGDICVLISNKTCEDQPCFPGVECEDFPLPDPNDVGLLRILDIIVRYQCGPCPPGYVGEGENCADINECEVEPPITNCHFNADCENIPGDYVCMCSDGFFGNGTHCSLLVKPKEIVDPFVNLTVLVLAAEPTDGDPILSSAVVRTFVSDPTSESGTREHRRARTADNGMAVLECPQKESIIVTANDADYFANSVTFRCNIDQTNVVTLPLHKPYEDTIYVYHPESPREFGVGNETLNEKYSTFLPEDSFNISDNRRVQVLFRSVNVSVTSELELVPEMIACIPKPPEEPNRGEVGAPQPFDDDVDIRAIETFGVVELTVTDFETKTAPPFKDDKKMVLKFPFQKSANLSAGDKVPAWKFKVRSGCWEKDGEGELVIDKGNLVWRYEANHFSWWAAGRVNPRTSCVTFRTCYDKDCSRPAPDTLIRIFGRDYGFETFRYTDTEGQTCVQFPYGRTVQLSSPCTDKAIEVESTENPSSCDEGQSEIPKVPDYQMEETQDSCREEVLVVPEYERSCPQPEKVHNNLSLDKSMIRDSYPYTDVVHYSCSNPDEDITTHGLGNRVCTRCYSWTGNLMCEAAEDEEPSYY